MMVGMRYLLILFFNLCICAGCSSSNQEPDLVWGKRGIRPGDFIKPRAITVGRDSSGNEELYIVDFAGRIQVFDLLGKPLRNWSTPSIENGRPAGLAWSARQQQLLVADSHYQRVLCYSPTGKLMRTITGDDTALGPFQYIGDVVEDQEGNLYLSEFGNEEQDRIRKLTWDGKLISSWGGHGTEVGQFSRPRGMAISNVNELFVADSCNHRIQVFDLDGRHLRTIGSHGSEVGKMQYPYDVTKGNHDEICVTEWGQNRIQRFTTQGKSLGIWGKPGRNPGCLFQPWGACVSQAGLVFVLDSENHRVQRVKW